MNRVTKIVLSKCKTKCTVYMESGDNLHFDFAKLNINYISGLIAIQYLYGEFKQNIKAA